VHIFGGYMSKWNGIRACDGNLLWVFKKLKVIKGAYLSFDGNNGKSTWIVK
jgi:hypothetical protein